MNNSPLLMWEELSIVLSSSLPQTFLWGSVVHARPWAGRWRSHGDGNPPGPCAGAEASRQQVRIERPRITFALRHHWGVQGLWGQSSGTFWNRAFLWLGASSCHHLTWEEEPCSRLCAAAGLLTRSPGLGMTIWLQVSQSGWGTCERHWYVSLQHLLCHRVLIC